MIQNIIKNKYLKQILTNLILIFWIRNKIILFLARKMSLLRKNNNNLTNFL